MAQRMILLVLGVHLAPVVGNRINRDLGELHDAAHLRAHGNASMKSTFAKPEITTIKNWDFMRSYKDSSWGRPSVRRVNENADVGPGHQCLASSPKEARYYTSSFCYWFPDKAPVNQVSRSSNVGLTWAGAKEKDPAMCSLNPKLVPGKCARCVACHDNGRTRRDGKVTVGYQQAPTEVPLPADCVLESKIHAECTTEFNNLNPSLVAENARCDKVKARYKEAVRLLKLYQTRISTHTARIKSNTQRIPLVQQKLQRQQSLLVEHQRNYQRAQQQQQQVCGCYTYSAYDTCRSRCLAEDYACISACRNVRNNAARMRRQVSRTKSYISDYNSEINTLQSQITSSHSTLEWAKGKLPNAQAERDSIEAEWSPQSAKCEATFVENDEKYAAHMAKCIPTWYDRSCEKACVELSIEQGCGVLEGGVRDDALGRGGPHAICKPPVPSWILPGTECERIEATQKEARLQHVLKSGFMRTKESGIFKKIWLVLESGTAARSATLRVFADIHGNEWVNKFVILWDAMEVAYEAKKRGKYTKCIVIKHHYEGRKKKYNKKGHEIMFCVDNEETTGLSETETAQEWLEALKPLVGGGHKGGR